MLKHQVFIAAGLALAVQGVLAQGLPEEIQARQAGDAQLQTNINNEAAARAAADMTLQNNIAAEASARSSADNELGGRITDETVSRMQAIEQLRQLIGSGGGGGTANVDCNSGGSIGQALAAGATQIIVRGICSETVTINRDDVTLQGEPGTGATIQGLNDNTNVVTVRGHRVTLQHLTIRDGRNGITALGAANLTVRDVTVESASRNGIAFAFGSSGTIDQCVSRSNTRDGIVVDGAYARIINCTVTNNARNGILVVNGGNSPMGFTDRFEAAPNVIRQNGLSGVSIALGSLATVALSEITGNGFPPTGPATGPGISVFQSTASISGGNNISDNAGPGISISGSRVIVGDAGPGLSTVNQIRTNGRSIASAGLLGNLGSAILIRDAQIVGNNGAGLSLQLRSAGQITNSNIEGNTRSGIELVHGAALSPFSSPSGTTVTANALLGLVCSDSESSVTMAGPSGPPFSLVFSGNTLGDFSCTSFDQPPAFPPPPAPLP
jgi:hypothetical protein